MKHLRLTILLFSVVIPLNLFADYQSDDSALYGRTFFHGRSIGSNNARDSAGIGYLITWGYDDCSNGVLWSTAEYSKSFNKHDIGKYLFFNNTATMQTGTAAGPGIDVFSQNFLLNDNFDSAITARPTVQNELIDVNLFYGFDIGCYTFYVLAHLPYVSTQWSIDFKETVSTSGSIILANELGNPIDTPSPFNSWITAWNGQATFFDVQQPLQYARVDGKQKKSRFADFECALGCIFLNDECNYFSINIRTIIPTGNRPNGVFFFEPIVGNGHYYEVGAGILGNFLLWESSCDEFLTGFVNGTIYSMLESKQKRTLDMKNNGIGSRYLLFKRFNNDAYAGEIIRGPNILTLPVKTKNRVHGDLVFMLEYLHCNLILDAGYNLWGRTRDHIEVVGQIPANTYGIAGLSGTAGAGRNTTAHLTQIDGSNASILDASPVYISNSDLDFESAAHPGTFSHSFFIYAGYLCDWHWGQPFIGVGGDIEYSGTNKSFKMGHIWTKVGLSF